MLLQPSLTFIFVCLAVKTLSLSSRDALSVLSLSRACRTSDNTDESPVGGGGVSGEGGLSLLLASEEEEDGEGGDAKEGEGEGEGMDTIVGEVRPSIVITACDQPSGLYGNQLQK